jgi:hypothetical protein
MKLILTVGFALLLGSAVCRGAFVNAWFNEFHYDNTGTDSGEFVEIAVPSSFSDLGNLLVSLYNGANGTVYSSALVSTFTAGAVSGGYTFYSLNLPANGLQNGSPDGFALSHSGTVIQFLSYEGVFSATAGAAIGQNSTDIGIFESDSTPAGSSLGLVGVGANYADFTWASFSNDDTHTRGAVNFNQTITAAVPEPSTFIAGALLLLPFGARGIRYLRNQKLS